MKRSKDLKRKKPLFKPDDIADKLYTGIIRDLNQPFLYRADYRASQYVRKTQPKSLLKKYLSRDSVDSSLEVTTFIKFLYVNEHMGSYLEEVKPLHDRITHLGDYDIHSNILHKAKRLMYLILGELNEDEWFRECKNSTGSSIGVPFRDTSLEKKFTFPLSSTERAKNLFEYYLSFDQRLKDSLEKSNEIPLTGMYNIVSGSRATTVEKTNSIRRMICIEPTVNMYFQQGLMSVMYKKMEKVGLDLETLPETHKEFAYESSITSQYATIDWSSASDCVSPALLRWLLPPKWYSALDLVRSKTATIDGSSIELNMFSTMGNAGTFPLETLVFWTMAMSCINEQRSSDNSVLPKWQYSKHCSVFGDDCIVPSSVAPLFIKTMERVGFILNKEKTFLADEGFRESCGGDYYHGFPVRPLYLKAPSTTRKSNLEPWLYTCMNAIIKKYITYFGGLSYVYDKHVFKVFSKLFQKYNLRMKIIPDYFPDDAGVKLHGDHKRFLDYYNFSLSPIVKDQHGTISFNYCRFLFREKLQTIDDLRYSVWLKKPVITSKLSGSLLDSKTYRRRINGGYIVAKASSSFWSFDQI